MWNAARAGSNSWAVSGSHTTDGHPIVANDPHLPVQVPNVWYRLSIEWRDEDGNTRRVTGASLPGLPLVAIGSNGHVAWGFTVAFDDRSDLVILEPAGRPNEYRTPAGSRPLEFDTEWIKVRGAGDERLVITSTIWGPVVGARGPNFTAQEWQAHHPDGVNLGFLEMERATTVEQALGIANRSGMPSYNIVVADDRGSIGWTVTGRLPRRVGFDGRVPTSWADGTRRWDGWLDPADYPRIVNPASGRVWTANNRTIDHPLLDRLGLEGYVMGPRARQVRDDLMATGRLTPEDSLRIQLDDRALFLDRWRTFLLEQLGDEATKRSTGRKEFRRLLQASWDGRASANSVGYLLIRNIRYELARRVVYPIARPGSTRDFAPGAVIEWWESALWRMVHERPSHLLPRGSNWTQVILDAVDATIAHATEGGRTLAFASWGTTTERIRHPLSRGAPWLSPWLDLPFQPLPGDTNMPRVRMPTPIAPLTASLRMVVSPGHEETGILHMPTGQSGHPLSPHYGDMQAGWVEGRPTPFLPGRTVHTLTLEKK
jgi:penicillin amidase